MKLGLLGGTFDPPHHGHLRLAQAALDQLQLDQVLFAPAGVQPLRQTERHTPPEQRARMVELTIADRPRCALSRLDLDRPGPHYTVDLLALAQQQFPKAALWFILGEDSLCDLLRWREPARLIALARLAVLRRAGAKPDWATLDAVLPDLRSRLDWLDHAAIDLSAQSIRQRVKDGLPIDHLVPTAVAAYIAEHHLYDEPVTPT
jgi:nicotinate-nucleotide adenylyltransferase